jgi:hypothetical protein
MFYFCLKSLFYYTVRYFQEVDTVVRCWLVLLGSVVDPHHVGADPYADFYLMRIRIRIWIQLFTMIRIQILASNERIKPSKRAYIGSYSIHFLVSAAN